MIEDYQETNCIECEHFKDYKCGDNNTVKICECPFCLYESESKENKNE